MIHNNFEKFSFIDIAIESLNQANGFFIIGFKDMRFDHIEYP